MSGASANKDLIDVILPPTMQLCMRLLEPRATPDRVAGVSNGRAYAAKPVVICCPQNCCEFQQAICSNIAAGWMLITVPTVRSQIKEMWQYY